MCSSSRISTSVPPDMAWLVAVPRVLQGGALRGTSLSLALLRLSVDDLFWSGSVMWPGASVVGSTCSRLPVPNPHSAAP